MKLKAKILCIALIPLAILGTATAVLGNQKINEVLTENIENALRASAISVRDTLQYSDEGEFFVDEAGNMYKGNFNITENTDIADHLQTSADIDITVFFGDTRQMTSVCDKDGNRQLGTQAGSDIVTHVIENKEEYFSTDVSVVDQKYFGYYIPLYQSGSNEAVGMIFAGMPQKDAKAQILKIVVQIILIMGFVSIICFVAVFFIVRNMVKYLYIGENALEKISNGNLNVQLNNKILKRSDEIGSLCRAIVTLRDEMKDMIGNIKKQSSSLALSSNNLMEKAEKTALNIHQVDLAVDEIAQGATGQAEHTQKATENVAHMGNMILSTIEEIEQMNENAKLIKEMSESASLALNELQEINEHAKDSIDIISKQTTTTNISAQKIREATTLITNIAEETNLLSLNASIEAARAGEMGRGFAVVASQIQKLAEQSDESARRIDEIVNRLLSDSDKSVQTMNEVKAIMESQNKNVLETNTKMVQVIKGVEGSIEAMDIIAKHTMELDTSREVVIDTVENLAAIAQENAASTQQTAASMSEANGIISDMSQNAVGLKNIADEMEKNVQIFEL